MKEYILLTFIASVGISGLLTIHHEVKNSEKQDLYLDLHSFSSKPVSIQPIASMQSQLLIDQESIWPEVVLQITHYDAASIYYLDSGDGKKRKISNPEQILCYEQSALVLVKLFKDNILVDAVEFYVDIDKNSSVKLVSF